MRKKQLSCLAVTASLSFILTGCRILPEEETFPASPVIQSYEAQEYRLTSVLRGDLAITKNVKCSYMPAKQESLCFELSGEIIEGIYVTGGQEVKAGQLLAKIEQEDLAEQVDQLEYELQVLDVQKAYLMERWELEEQLLEAKYDVESTDYEAQKAVVDAKYILQLEANRDSVYIKELRLQELREDVQKRELYATMDGTVTYVRDIQDKEVSVEDRVMITIADMDSTAFAVKGDDAEYFEVGMEVVITKGKEQYEAICVDAAELGLALETGDNRAYFQLLQPDPTLESGNSGQIEVVLDSRKDALYVNKKAIKTAGGKLFVYVLNEEGLRETKDVTVGAEFGNVIEILSGLEEGESIILN